MWRALICWHVASLCSTTTVTVRTSTMFFVMIRSVMFSVYPLRTVVGSHRFWLAKTGCLESFRFVGLQENQSCKIRCNRIKNTNFFFYLYALKIRKLKSKKKKKGTMIPGSEINISKILVLLT